MFRPNDSRSGDYQSRLRIYGTSKGAITQSIYKSSSKAIPASTSVSHSSRILQLVQFKKIAMLVVSRLP